MSFHLLIVFEKMDLLYRDQQLCSTRVLISLYLLIMRPLEQRNVMQSQATLFAQLAACLMKTPATSEKHRLRLQTCDPSSADDTFGYSLRTGYLHRLFYPFYCAMRCVKSCQCCCCFDGTVDIQLNAGRTLDKRLNCVVSRIIVQCCIHEQTSLIYNPMKLLLLTFDQVSPSMVPTAAYKDVSLSKRIIKKE